jgi:ATP-dependent exoDNAse (exonuclease V) alpha subunit
MLDIPLPEHWRHHLLCSGIEIPRDCGIVMAIYRLEAQIISRGTGRRSVISAAAYRTGKKLRDELRQKIHDYTHRAKSVLRSLILAPEGAPAWVRDSCSLWNAVERGEKRIDAQLAREILLSLPRELTTEAQFQLAVDWANKELVSLGMVVEVCHHNDKDGTNPHAHLLCTMRKLDGDKFAAKKSREWNSIEWLVKQRASWAGAENAALEKAGSTERVDHRSLKDQGIDREPQPKIGVEATAMKRRGVIFDHPRLRRFREVLMRNQMRPFVQAIRKFGHVHQRGLGNRWWEQSLCLASKVRERTTEAVKVQRQKASAAARPTRGKDGPER